ncbi:MAG: MaoC family dehydratase N-terminal domain-containing protein [Thermoleophilaceae bacterium]
MPVELSAKGKTYPACTYEIGREKIREYARAVGEDNPVYLERDAARAAGFRDVAAPPMFAVVYSSEALMAGLFDPEVGIDFARLVHGGQEFAWGEPVCSGDTIGTTLALEDIYERAGLAFYVFESVSSNQDGAEVVRGTWTNIVRGE